MYTDSQRNIYICVSTHTHTQIFSFVIELSYLFQKTQQIVRLIDRFVFQKNFHLNIMNGPVVCYNRYLLYLSISADMTFLLNVMNGPVVCYNRYLLYLSISADMTFHLNIMNGPMISYNRYLLYLSISADMTFHLNIMNGQMISYYRYLLHLSISTHILTNISIWCEILILILYLSQHIPKISVAGFSIICFRHFQQTPPPEKVFYDSTVVWPELDEPEQQYSLLSSICEAGLESRNPCDFLHRAFYLFTGTCTYIQKS